MSVGYEPGSEARALLERSRVLNAAANLQMSPLANLGNTTVVYVRQPLHTREMLVNYDKQWH